jgi:hypothetical protein
LDIKPLIGHGDGKGPGDMDKRMKKYLQTIFKWLLVGYIPILEVWHKYQSVKNKLISGDEDINFLERTRWLIHSGREN